MSVTYLEIVSENRKENRYPFPGCFGVSFLRIKKLSIISLTLSLVPWEKWLVRLCGCFLSCSGPVSPGMVFKHLILPCLCVHGIFIHSQTNPNAFFDYYQL